MSGVSGVRVRCGRKHSTPKGVYRSSYRIYSKFIISRACHWKKFFQLFGDAFLLSPRKNCLSVPKPSFMTVLLDDTLAAQLKNVLGNREDNGKTGTTERYSW